MWAIFFPSNYSYGHVGGSLYNPSEENSTRSQRIFVQKRKLTKKFFSDVFSPPKILRTRSKQFWQLNQKEIARRPEIFRSFSGNGQEKVPISNSFFIELFLWICRLLFWQTRRKKTTKSRYFLTPCRKVFKKVRKNVFAELSLITRKMQIWQSFRKNFYRKPSVFCSMSLFHENFYMFQQSFSPYFSYRHVGYSFDNPAEKKCEKHLKSSINIPTLWKH